MSKRDEYLDNAAQ